MANPSLSTTFLLLLLLFSILPHSLSSSERKQTYIIHLSKPHNNPTTLLQSLSSSPSSSSILYTYHHTLHGFSALLTPSQAAALRRHSSVLSLLPDRIRHPHTTRTPQFLGLSDSSGLWPNSHYAADVIVGVLDTGIYPDRRSFDDSGLGPVPAGWRGACVASEEFPASSCNRKLIGAKAFYKGYETYLRKPINESIEAKSPLDTKGHGTHTASTAAGSVVTNASFFGFAAGEARGMASGARIAAYKICWKVGCFDSDILAAMDEAVSDGVDVISLSVGASGYAPRYYRDSIAIGAFGAVQHGIVVSCSAGNSGPRPFTAVNIAPWILTVGASTIDREFPADVVLGDGRVFGGVSLYSSSSSSYSNGKYPLVYAGDSGGSYCYPGQLDSKKVEGKIVVCQRGGNARVAKGSAVKLAGGAGMILANTDQNGEELIADSHFIPATMVGSAAGDKIREYVKSDPSPTAEILFRGTVIGLKPPAPKVAAFSSRGPSYLTAEILKPDVIAPGVNILAAWTGANAPTDLEIDPRRVEFNIISGTSMSCPHVSGLAALLRKAYPEWSPAAIKSALMTTAYNLDNSGNNIKDLASGEESSPFVHGAGHVDPNRALDPGLVYDIDTDEYVRFLCSIGYDLRRIAVFTRETMSSDTCKSKLATPGDLNYPSFSVVFGWGISVVRYRRVVKNVGSSVDATYKVKVTFPPTVEVSVSPSELVFSAENQTLPYEVTFTSIMSAPLALIPDSFGAIEWSDGIHNVRSPVAIRWQHQFMESM